MSEPGIRNALDAQGVVKRKLQDEYGRGADVSFSKTALETRVVNGRKFWVVEGNVKVRKKLFWKKMWHFTYYIDVDAGKISIMRGRRM